MRSLRNTALLMVVLALVACERRDTTRDETVGTTGITGEATATNDHDRIFVEKATIDGMTEVQLGEIAARFGANEQVKAFGTRMANDHRKAGDELKGHVQMIGMAMPLKLDTEHQELVDRLSTLKGADFDREYMRAMTDAHTKAVELFEREALQGQNAHLKQWAEQTLPTLRKHLDMTRDVRAKVDRAATY